MRFIIESSKTPIYNRIVLAIINALQEHGHEVLFINAEKFEPDDFINCINQISIDYYIVTNDNNYINKKKSDENGFLIDEILHKIIYIHHDSSFCKPGTLNEIDEYLLSLIKSKDRIFHFFIEKSNILQFNKLGIDNCYHILHASEFSRDFIESEYAFGVSFVGHLMSGLRAYPTESLLVNHHMMYLAWARLSNSSFEIQPEIERLAEDWHTYHHVNEKIFRSLSVFQLLMHEVTKLSSAYRGELLSTINNQHLHIIGGDLSYGKINNPLLKLNKPNVSYHPATENYGDTRSIYSKTKVSLNISSLQFDTAINNRIIDVVMSGGFIVTDRRNDLLSYSPTSIEIVYDSPEEMNYLIDFYMHPSNHKKYMEIKEQIYSEFSESFSYTNSISSILERLK